MEDKKYGTVCVSGGTGFLASWLITRLLQHGYSVNTTIRTDPGCKKDISYLTSLPGASERLKIFNADLNNPDSFAPAIEGCLGVFHVAHPMDRADEKETQDSRTQRIIGGLLGILRASLDAKTVKRFIYTSSATAVVFNDKNLDIMDEDSWTDVDMVRSRGDSYALNKTLAETAALEFGEKHGLDVVTVVPTWINGPFLGPRCPRSVRVSLALIFGDKENYRFIIDTSFVHVDDVARAHIFLLEYPNAKGRYICSFGAEVTIDKLSEFLSARYPECQIPTVDSWNGILPVKISGLSSKKLLETGFEYLHGIEDMFDGAIQSCKEKSLL